MSKTVTIFGGSGFIGRYVVEDLCKKDYKVRVITRDCVAAEHLKTAGFPGQVSLEYGDLLKDETVKDKFENSYAVINLVGILFEKGRQKFDELHAKAADRLAKHAKAAGVQRFIQVSASGVDRSLKSEYARTKSLAEKSIWAAFPKATVIRPSVVFGAQDNFLNQFAKMSVVSPFLPLIGGGKTKFQPVFVADLAQAIVNALGMDETKGKVYEVGGPEVYSFREILEFILEQTGRKSTLVNIPFGPAKMIGAFASLLPKPPLTADQVNLLQNDNVVYTNSLKITDLGVKPASMKDVAPGYLSIYRRYNS